MDDSSSTAVGGNVSAGGDFIGRDRQTVTGNRVEINHEPRQRADEMSETELLRNLHRAIIGNPFRANEPGLVRAVDSLADSMSSLKVWKATVDFERERTAAELSEYRRVVESHHQTAESRLSSVMAIVWITLSIVGIEALALLWLFARLSF